MKEKGQGESSGKRAGQERRDQGTRKERREKRK